MIKLATAYYFYPHSILSDEAALYRPWRRCCIVLEGLASFTTMLQWRALTRCAKGPPYTDRLTRWGQSTGGPRSSGAALSLEFSGVFASQPVNDVISFCCVVLMSRTLSHRVGGWGGGGGGGGGGLWGGWLHQHWLVDCVNHLRREGEGEWGEQVRQRERERGTVTTWSGASSLSVHILWHICKANLAKCVCIWERRGIGWHSWGNARQPVFELERVHVCACMFSGVGCVTGSYGKRDQTQGGLASGGG